MPTLERHRWIQGWIWVALAVCVTSSLASTYIENLVCTAFVGSTRVGALDSGFMRRFCTSGCPRFRFLNAFGVGHTNGAPVSDLFGIGATNAAVPVVIGVGYTRL